MKRSLEHVFVKPLKHHNIYMSPLAVTHVVKFGDHSHEVDWHESLELDKLTKPMDLTEIHKLFTEREIQKILDEMTYEQE